MTILARHHSDTWMDFRETIWGQVIDFWNGVGLNGSKDGDGSIELKLREGALSCLLVCPKSGT